MKKLILISLMACLALGVSTAQTQMYSIKNMGVPDGMKVDREGNLYVTGPGGIWVWSPGGRRLGRIFLPSTAANLTWGGPDRSTLWITAGHYVYALKMKAFGYLPYTEPKETK